MGPAMQIRDFIPVWDMLQKEQQAQLQESAAERHASQGAMLHYGAGECEGLFCVMTGQLRAFVLSEEGKEITIYRLLPGNMCLFSASCMFSGLRLDISIEAEKETDLLVIPAAAYRRIMEQSPALANYTNQLMAERFSDVMWLMEQILWKSMDRRLAAFLLEEGRIDRTDTITITHERIASHLGTAREVVTRMLKYLQSEGLITLARGEIRIADRRRLAQLAES